MNLRPLPYAPAPYANELLTSWTERVALFYDGRYAQALMLLAPMTPVAKGEVVDYDADPALRERLAHWTGRDPKGIPSLLEVTHRKALEVVARLAYCPQCWDTDVLKGGAPYVRRQWTDWSTVHCPFHEQWLAAKRPRTFHEGHWNEWAPVWSSRRSWAEASHVKHDPLRQVNANGFVPDELESSRGGWRAFAHAVETLILYSPAVMAAVVGAKFQSLRGQVLAALRRTPPTSRLNDHDLIGYRSAQPGWLAERIACLVTAVEMDRMVRQQEPLFPRAWEIVTQAQCRLAWIGSMRPRGNRGFDP